MRPFPSFSSIIRLLLGGALLWALLGGSPLPARSEGSVDFPRFERELNSLVPELMRKHGVVGAQIHVFESVRDRRLSLRFGHADADRTVPIQPRTLFQASELVRPLTAYLALRAAAQRARSVDGPPDGGWYSYLRRPVDELPDFPFQRDPDVEGLTRLPGPYHLLTMSAGLPPSRDGLIRGDLPRPDPDAYLRARLVLRSGPGQHIASSPESYAYVGQILEAAHGRSFAELARETLGRDFGITAACVRANDCPSDLPFASGTVHSGEFVFTETPAHVMYPAADSLWISAADYGTFLSAAVLRARHDPVVDGLFGPAQQHHLDLGGMTMGFQMLRPTGGARGEAAPLWAYAIEGRQPGFASYALVTPDGRGAVVMCNASERFFVRELASYLFDRFGLYAKNPPAPTAQAIARTRELQGSYRARAAVPDRESALAFLTDARIRIDARGIEFGGVFQKQSQVRLYPIEADLYVARGVATMDGWRVRVRRDGRGQVTGLDTDLVQYDLVSPIFSAWAILIYLGILTSVPVLLLMLFLIRRGGRT